MKLIKGYKILSSLEDMPARQFAKFQEYLVTTKMKGEAVMQQLTMAIQTGKIEDQIEAQKAISQLIGFYSSGYDPFLLAFGCLFFDCKDITDSGITDFLSNSKAIDAFTYKEAVILVYETAKIMRQECASIAPNIATEQANISLNLQHKRALILLECMINGYDEQKGKELYEITTQWVDLYGAGKLFLADPDNDVNMLMRYFQRLFLELSKRGISNVRELTAMEFLVTIELEKASK